MRENKILTLGIFIALHIAATNKSFSQCDNSGIGLTTPTSKLHIKGCGSTNATSSLNVMNSSSSSMLFVSDDGKIGVGTTSPQYTFHINGSTEWPILLRSSNSNYGNRNHVLMQRSNNGSAVTTDFNLGGISISGYDGTQYGQGWNGGAEINAYATQTWAPTNRGTALGFFTTANNTTVLTERMRISENGNIGIGTISPYYKLDVAGDIYAYQGSLLCSKSNDEGGCIMQFNHTKSSVGQNQIYKHWNMTGIYGNKYSIWGYPAVGNGVERFSIWDNGETSLCNETGAYIAKFTKTGALGLYNASPTEAFQIGTSIAMHDGGDKLLAFGWAPTPNTDLSASAYASELRFTPSNGNISFGISSSVTTLPITKLVLDRNGNLGLGTSGPSTTIHFKDGHIRSEQTTAPAIAVSTANGITAAALSSGSTDTKGTITTTGDNNGTNTVITVTYNKVYTVAPVVVVSASNASGQAYTFFASSGTNNFTVNLRDAGTNATPSFNYIVIE